MEQPFVGVARHGLRRLGQDRSHGGTPHHGYRSATGTPRSRPGLHGPRRITAYEKSGRSRHSARVIERLLQIDRGIGLGNELEALALYAGPAVAAGNDD